MIRYEGETMNMNDLQKALLNKYKSHEEFNVIDEVLHHVTKTQPEELREFIDKQPTTKEEQLIKKMEELSPMELLYHLKGGIEPGIKDLITISDIMKDQKLNAGVVNVLIYFIMSITVEKLPKAYTERIASHWARKRIKTVREAIEVMEMAKREIKYYREWQNKKAKSTKHNWSAFIDKMRKKGYTPEELERIVELHEQTKND